MFCHFLISVAGSPPRKVVFRLRPDESPKTCDNFAALCQSAATAKRPPPPSSSAVAASANRRDAAPHQQPTYRGTEFHRILPGFMVQGGDFENFDGTGGFPAVTTNQGRLTFPDENFRMSHDREGVLSMANRGKDTNGSQFFVTLGKALHLDGKHVAFGHVVQGMEVLRDAAKVETEGSNGRPAMLQRVVVVDCGLGTGDDDEESSGTGSSVSGSSSSSKYSSTDDDRRRKRRKKKKRRRRNDGGGPSLKKKKSRDRSTRSRSRRKRHDKDEHKRKKRRDKEAQGYKSRDYSSSSEEERRRRSSKKRHKGNHRKDSMRDCKKESG